MAVKKKLDNIYSGQNSLEDIYDTQNALDKGILGSVAIDTSFTGNKGSTFNKTLQYNNDANTSSVFEPNNGSTIQGNSFASILGMNDAINANRKKRAEQDKASGQGFGLSSSILGGGAF